jgi:SAM-dependent methyltransferase
MILRRLVKVFEAGGIRGVLGAVARRAAMPRARSFAHCAAVVQGRAGLEVGGPSPIFARGGLLPLYPVAERVDNVNFAACTLWEGQISDGESFRYDRSKAPGRQFIGEGSDLSAIGDGTYDFLLSSHMLEHAADPLRALREWQRVLRVGGGLVLVLPHRDGTFDHRRAVTTLAHLQEDLARGTEEDDTTHVEEILARHDITRDPGAGDPATFRDRALRNAELRSLHHHVFDARLAMAAVEAVGLVVTAVETFRPYHILVVAVRPGGAAPVSALAAGARGAALARSPFATDRST